MHSADPAVIASIITDAGCVVFLINLPLVFRKVPMNVFYGIRVREAFRSDQLWYDINAYGGRVLAWWSLAIIVVGASGFFVPGRYLDRYVTFASVVAIGSVGAAFAQTMRWVHRTTKV